MLALQSQYDSETSAKLMQSHLLQIPKINLFPVPLLTRILTDMQITWNKKNELLFPVQT